MFVCVVFMNSSRVDVDNVMCKRMTQYQLDRARAELQRRVTREEIKRVRFLRV